MKKTCLIPLFLLIFIFSHAQTPAVTSFTLVNADNEQDLLVFSNTSPTVLNLATLPTRNLNIRANTNPAKVGSVRFALSGQQTLHPTESSAPYALFGDSNGQYYPWTPAAGHYTLQATPYSSSNGGGKAGTALTITFEVSSQAAGNRLPVANAGPDQVVTGPASSTQLSGSGTDADGSISGYTWTQESGPNTASFSSKTVANPTVSGLVKGTYVFSLTVKDNQNAQSAADQVQVSVEETGTATAVNSFTLVNADTEQDIMELSATTTTTLDLSSLPTRNLNIRANTSSTSVKSVAYALSGPQSRTYTESAAPYALFGDSNGNYNAWTPAAGRYTLQATPYSSSNGGGKAGTALTITFEVSSQAAGNRLPVANAGPDQVVTGPASSTQLSGSGTDADGSISGYTWTQESGPNTASFSSKTVANPTVSGLVKGTYVFSLTVKDNQNAQSAADQVQVSVVEADPDPAGPAVLSGELKKWHKLTLTFNGPAADENTTPNPFLDYRLNVTFSNGSHHLTVPGYFAADGNAGETGATAGNKWRVHFTPPATGTWTWSASFRTGTNIAVSTSATAGTAVAPNGVSGSFQVAASDKTGPDLRAKGRLQYTGQHYLQFAETGQYFLKGGADSPENFLAYQEFDGTPSWTKTYSPHTGDWVAGNPTWKGGKGKGIIGALNYLAGKGMNSVYFLTMNVKGDGGDVWPWTTSSERLRYDVSKLDQWEVVFSHMDQKGLMLHVVTQEEENDQLLDGGALGVQRQLYYRELIARFSHHLAITWNLGEENTNTDAQRKAFADYIRQLDPYKSFITVHSLPSDPAVYPALLGYPTVEGTSLQIVNVGTVHSETLKWVQQSASKGHKWVVNLDEIGPANDGVVPDANDRTHDQVRKKALWGNLMAGGAGVEWYFGYGYPNSDLSAQDWRSRDHMWDLTRFALEFFQQHLPYWNMKNDNNLTASTTDYCLALPGQAYAVYLPDGGTTTLNVGPARNTYQVRWYNPRTGGPLQNGSLLEFSGSGNQALGNPPADANQDWVVLVTQSTTGSATAGARTSAIGNPGISQQENLTTQPGEQAPGLWFYPNPFGSRATIQVVLPKAAPVVVSITDLLGRQIVLDTSPPVKRYAKELDGSQLMPGVYLLKIKYGNGSVVKRIVKY